MKAGAFYWKAAFDEEAGKVDVEEYGCRSIRSGRASMILKASWTWGKRSKKNGDFGWLDPVPTWCRTMVRLEDEWSGPDLYRPTRKGALMAALAKARKQRAAAKAVERREYLDAAIAAFAARLRRQA